MKKLMFALLLSCISIVPVSAASSKECKGHKFISQILHDFRKAKAEKESWDEEIAYDRSIKEHSSEMYKDGDWWTIEFEWTHVDDCPECDGFAAKSDTEKSE